MLTISISETLAMGPSAWSMWNEHADASEGSVQWGEQWSLVDDQALYAAYDTWGLAPDLAASVQDSLLPETEMQEPIKVPNSIGDSPVPLTAFASPLRVPLPKPLTLHEEDSALTELPPGLDDLDMGMLWEEVLTQVSEQARQEAEEDSHAIPQPPGLLALAASESVSAAAAESRKPALPTLTAPCEDQAPQGVSISTTGLGKQVDWQIESFRSKLQSNNGRPLVSPPFSACGLPNLRLMVSVDTKESAKSKSAKAKTASKGATKKGPLVGSLKLKADCLTGGATILNFNLLVGLVKLGPFSFDFSQQAVHGPEDFGIDWLGQIDANTGGISVGVEVLETRLREN